MLWLIVPVALVTVVVIGLLVYARSRSGTREEEHAVGPDGLRTAIERELTRLAREQGFERRLVSLDGSCGLALHPDGHRLLLVAPEVPGAEPAPGETVPFFVRVYPAPDILGVERREFDVIRLEKDAPELRVRSIELHVFVDDTERPTHVVTLLDKSAKRMSKRHKDAAATAATWEGLLRIAVRRGSMPRSLVVERASTVERTHPNVERAPADRTGPVERPPPERVGPPSAAPAGPPPLPILEPRAVTRVVDDPNEKPTADAARREQARQRLLQRARASQG